MAPPLTHDQIIDVCKVYAPPAHEQAISFLFLHGVRPGEMRAILMKKNRPRE